MKKQILSSLALVATLVALAPVAQAQNVAIVNGKAIPKSRYDMLANQVTASGKTITPEIEKQLKDEVIAREVFIQEAQARGLDASDDYKTQLEMARQTLLIRSLFADYVKKNPISDEEVKAEYDRFVAANSGKEFKARHILVEKEEQAKALIAQLKKGAKFEDLAKKNSKDPGSGANGGDLGWANPGNYVKEFGEALVALGKGKLTETPVKTQFGYHVIRVDDVRDAQLPKFEDVKGQVAQQMQQQRVVKFQEELRGKAKIE